MNTLANLGQLKTMGLPQCSYSHNASRRHCVRQGKGTSAPPSPPLLSSRRSGFEERSVRMSIASIIVACLLHKQSEVCDSQGGLPTYVVVLC